MGRVLRAILHAAAQLLAGAFSGLFVVATILVLTLLSVDRALLNADTYKRALAEQGIYERVPALAAEQLGALETFIANPCAENPLMCRIDGASPELQSCLTAALTEEALVEIGSFKREPTEAELQLAQPCLDQYAASTTPESALAASSAEVQACVKRALGEEVFDTLLHEERPPTDAEGQTMALCSEAPGGNAFASEAGGGPGNPSGADTGGDPGAYGDTGAGSEPEDSSNAAVGGDPTGFMNSLAPEDLVRLISAVLPPDDLQVMTEQTLDQVFAFLNGDVDSAKVSLVALRERLAGPAGQEVIQVLLAAQPPCTEAQLTQLTKDATEEAVDLVLCRPQTEDSDALVFLMEEQFNALVSEMPDQAELIKPPSPSSPPGGGGPLGADPLAAFRGLHRWLWLSLLLPLALLLPVTVFGVRSRRGWLRWWGIPMFIAGLLTAGLGLAVLPALDWAWVNFIADKMPPMLSSSMSGLAHELANSVVAELTKWTVLSGAAVMLLGLAAIVASSHLKPKGVVAAAPPPVP